MLKIIYLFKYIISIKYINIFIYYFFNIKDYLIV